jgi:hypothetical protein
VSSRIPSSSRSGDAHYLLSDGYPLWRLPDIKLRHTPPPIVSCFRDRPLWTVAGHRPHPCCVGCNDMGLHEGSARRPATAWCGGGLTGWTGRWWQLGEYKDDDTSTSGAGVDCWAHSGLLEPFLGRTTDCVPSLFDAAIGCKMNGDLVFTSLSHSFNNVRGSGSLGGKGGRRRICCRTALVPQRVAPTPFTAAPGDLPPPRMRGCAVGHRAPPLCRFTP